MLRYSEGLKKRIQGLASYRKAFPIAARRRAYKLALEIRQFEIELYWKRATYFWTIIAATFAGYFTLATSDKFRPHPAFFSSSVV